MALAKRFSKRHWYRRVNAPLWAALGGTLLCAVLFLGHRSELWSLPGLDAWERSTGDLRFRLRGTTQPKSDDIVIVALDDATRRGLPALWQTRVGFARLIDKVRDSQPRAFGVDAFFSSPEINLSSATVEAVRAARAALKRELELGAAAQEADDALALVEQETRGDDVLAETIGKSDRLVLALLFHLGGQPTAASMPEPDGIERAHLDESVHLPQPASRRPPQASGTIAPLAKIGQVVAHMGHVNVKYDEDGAVRQAPLIIERGGQLYQSLALKLASMHAGAATSFVTGEDFVTLGETRIQLSPRGFATIAYLGSNKTFPRISAQDVLAAEGGHPGLRDKLVLIGYTDAARDKLITPFDQQLDGVELHATLIHNLLHNELLHPASPWATASAIALIGAALTLLQLRRVRRRGAYLLGGGAMALSLLYAIVTQYLFSNVGLQLDLVAPILSAGVIAMIAMTASLATEGRERRQLRSAFGQYMQSTLVEKILQEPEQLRLGGQRRELTVLFSDIRSFSRFSETLDPEVLSDFLNEYLTPMTDLVMGDAGMLDKYIGDAVMAVYGAPIELDDHAERACGTALSMIRALPALNSRWVERKLPEIHIGIGINTGPMSVGNMGSQSRFDYTVMGDAVNLGARLESLTKTYGVNILVGEATMMAAKDRFVFRELDSVRVVGRSKSARIYELVGTAEEAPLSSRDQERFARALECYRSMQWAEAKESLRVYGAAHPGDGPTATLLARIAVLEKKPPPADWDGVFEQIDK